MRPKRLLFTLMAILLGINICQAKSFKYTYKNVTFKCKTVEGGVEVYGFDMKADVVVIPGFVVDNGTTYQVKSIDTFLNGVNYLASKIIIEEGVEYIESRAFMEFRNLKELTLPNTIRRIGKNIIRPKQAIAFNVPSYINADLIKEGSEQTRIPTKTYSAPPPKPSDLAIVGNSIQPKTTPVKEESSNKPTKEETKTKSSKEETKAKPSNEKTKTTPVKKTPATTPVREEALQETAVADYELDINIPKRKTRNTDNVYCVIIAIENYRDVSGVEFASNDGHIFMEYCKNTLGIPERHIRSFFDATYTDIKRALSWMENMADVTNGKAKMIFYYAGHGLPSDKDQSAYLLPSDGFPNDLTTCFKLSDVYDRLSKMNVQNITVLLDACFSGVKRGENKSLVASRGVAVKAKKTDISGNLVVLSAASDDETAFSYKTKKHGMFTYYLLKKLRESKGEATLGEMYDFVYDNVRRSSMLENDKKQTPSVNVSPAMKDTWKEIRF